MAKKSRCPVSYANVPGMRTKALPWILLPLLIATGCTNTVSSGGGSGISGTGLTLLIQLSPPDISVAGGNILVTVEALTADQNIATNFTGTVHLASSDPQASLPAQYTFTLADGGLKSFDATAVLRTAGVQTITIEGADGETSGSAKVTVKAAAVDKLQAASFPSGLGAGQQGNFLVTAYDVYGNVADGYTGEVSIATNNPNVVLSGAHLYNANDKGTHAFGITFQKAGMWSLTAQDSNVSHLTSEQTGIDVVPGAANTLVLAGLPAVASAGTAQSANVTVYDVYQNVATNFAGTLHFTTSDAQATVPLDYTYQTADAGVAKFDQGFVFLTASTAQNLTISADANLQTTGSIHVLPLAVAALAVVPSPNVVAGAAFDATVRATDMYGNVVPWIGTVHFDGSDASGTYPIDYLFTQGDHGQHQFSGVLTMLTAGAQNITATDNANALTQGTGQLAVAPAALHALTFGGLRWVTADANFTTQLIATDLYGNAATNFSGTINVYSSNGNFTPQTYTMDQNVGGVLPLPGLRFGAPGSPTLSANNTLNAVSSTAAFTVSAPVAFSMAQAANTVLGHVEFTAGSPVCGGYLSTNFWYPSGGIYVDAGGAVWLPDTLNHRVIGYNALPTAMGQVPDFEIGELSLDNAGPHWPSAEPTSPNSLSPGSVSSNGGAGLVVVDSLNNRVLVYNAEPSSTANADAVVGQANFTSSAAGCSSTTFNQPSDALVIGSRLFVSDTDNHRVLIWGNVPNGTSGVAASWVLGQPDLGTCVPGTDANQLHAPHGLWSNGVLLAVADSNNNRVLIWNDVSTLAADGVPVSLVIGQSSMTTATAGASAVAMQTPYGVFSNGTSLFVSDSGNHRVLVYPTMPTQSGAQATTALGQPDLTSHTAPVDNGQCVANGHSSATTLSTPYGIGLSGTTLIVGSVGESRYLLYPSH